MVEKIVIFLHANDLSHPSWVEMDAESNMKVTVQQGDAANLTQAAMDKEIIVIVPAEDVLLTKTNLPKLSRSRLALALPNALEEQLIADIDSLHYAPGEHKGDGELSVAIVAREKIQLWLAQLQAWNIQADVMLSALFALPYEDNVWHVLLNDLAVVRTENFTGFACDKVNLSALLNVALKSAVNVPQFIRIQGDDQEASLPSLHTAVKVEQEFFKTDELFADLAMNAVLFPGINLLQGNFAVKKSKFPQIGKIWKLAAALAASWVVLLLLYPIISYFILAHRINVIDDQIGQIYKQNFPQASSMVAPKLRMEEKLQKATGKIGENQLLLLVAYLGKGIAKAPGVKLKRFDFQNNQITVELSAASSDDFYAFTDFLMQHGLSVKQQNANLAGARVNATLVVVRK